jgi:hypothetical protein
VSSDTSALMLLTGTQEQKLCEILGAARETLASLSADAAPLETVEDSTSLGELKARAATCARDIDAWRRGLTDPLNSQIKQLIGLVSPVLEELRDFDRLCQTRLLAFTRTQAAAAETSRQMTKHFAATATNPFAPDPIVATRGVKTDSGTTSIRRTVDRTLIAAAVGAGVREISGVRIWQEWRFEVESAADVPDKYRSDSMPTRARRK